MAGFRKLITIDRDDDDAPSLLKRFNAHGRGPVTDRLRARYDDFARGSPHRTSESNFAEAWNSLSDAERDAVRAEEAMAERERARAEAAQREEANMTREGIIAELMTKNADALVKAILELGKPGVTEAELTKIYDATAQRDRRPGETEAQAFTRFLTEDSRAGRDRRVALQMSKRLTVPGGDFAYNALVAKAEDLRAANPKLTPAQAFSAVYTDPENRALVEIQKAEHRSRA